MHASALCTASLALASSSPPPSSLFCLYSLSFHSLSWLRLLFSEGKHQAALRSLFSFFPIISWNGISAGTGKT